MTEWQISPDAIAKHNEPLSKALEMLDYTWDNYFKYANPEPEAAPL